MPIAYRLTATVAGAFLAAVSLTGCGGSGSADELRAATTAAQRYVRIIATGDAADLARLPRLEVDGRERAVAVKQLADAQERIGATSVSDATAATKTAAPGAMGFTSFARTKVSYRLDGREHTASIVLGLPNGRSADKESSWLVLTPMVGELSWTATPSLSGFSPQIYVGAVAQDVHGNVDQPLYPGTYSARATYGALYASPSVPATVIAGKTSPGPGFSFRATEQTKRTVSKAITAAFRSCSAAAVTSTCPVMNGELARSTDFTGNWWGGLSVRPTIQIERNVVRLTGGQFVYRHGGRSERVDFVGSGTFTLTGEADPMIDVDDFYIALKPAH